MKLKGLYNQHDQCFVALDCIIFGFDEKGLKVLLIKRSFEPEKGKWSLMGGFLKSEESIRDAADRILNSLTGLSGVYMEQLHVYGEVNRDPVDRTISIAYYALINTDRYDKVLAEEHNAQWFPVSKIPQLIFDHKIMIKKALARLQRKSTTQPIGFELLPEKFTIPQLRNLYEAINNKAYDHRNFIKKISSMNWIVRLNVKDKSGSKKGAYYYRFDKLKYKKLLVSELNSD